MKIVALFCCAAGILFTSACTSSKDAQKRKLMGADDVSGLSWSRPESWEGGSGFGGLGGAAGEGL